MCGVAGILNFSEASSLSFGLSTIAENLKQDLLNRGPDGQHIFVTADYKNFFIQTRLAITDLSDAAIQPMISLCGNFLIVYNGEIYNQDFIKKAFLQDFEFRSESDTEIILEAFARTGPSLFSLLEGIFSIAIFNLRTATLFLARDHLGIKPLYFYHDARNRIFAFSSIAKSLAQNFTAMAINFRATLLFKQFGCVPGDESFFQNIYSVPAGSYFTVVDNKINAFKYHNAIDYLENDNDQMKQSCQSQNIMVKLKDVLRSQIPTKVEFGIFLSAGIDSNLLAKMVKALGYNFYTFTIGFETQGLIYKSESILAKKLATKLGSKHYEWIITVSEAKSLFNEYLQAMDQPTTDGFNIFLAAKLASQFCKVVLSGLGADELFLGYWHYLHLWNWIQLQNKFYKVPVQWLISKLRYLRVVKSLLYRSGRLFLAEPRLNTAQDVYLWYRSIDQNYYKAEAEFLKGIFETQEFSVIQKFVLGELYFYDQFKLLRDADVFSMYHGLELRVPFLDKRMISCGLKYLSDINHDNFKMKFGKQVLLELINQYDPSFRPIPKQGFELPFYEWLQVDNKDSFPTLINKVLSRHLALDP